MGYIPTLDGWRAIAIFGVMLFHGGPPLLGHPILFSLQRLGASGVELFFALSGILICSRLLDEEDAHGKISLRDFYLRRLFRIQPAAIFYLLAVGALAAAGFIAFSATGWWTALFSVRNLYRAPNLADGATYTGHFWSLAIEEHFYLVMPWLLVLLRGRNRNRWFGLLAAVALLSNAIMERTDFAKTQLSSEFELCWLFLAAWLALLMRHSENREFLRRYLPAGPVVAVMALIGFGVAMKWKLVWHIWFPTFPLLILATVLHPRSLPSRFLEWKPLRMVGRISFSLYLWQQLFCLMLRGVPTARWPLGLLQHPPQSFVCAFICAFASYFFVEKPFIKVGHRLTKRFARTPSTLSLKPLPASD